ncbi:MAG: SMP-30/gluconolactonase/LRE family protein, partial [Planctomycetaceae bacterium]|nr:SMP-30/gluconolactonase/LRE family protein [Planctomycetaceae bacterium]
DGKTLYVGDSHEKLWRSFPILEDGTVGEGRVFFDPATSRKDSPDGMSIDADGNLYLSGRGGVWVASPEGKSLGLISVPEFCSNVTFGGVDGKTLYFTCSNKVYSLKMKVKGGQFR